jgi:pilus assembly protein Flp/PilA
MLDMMRTYLRAVVKSERGATAVEYGIMVALIAIVIIGAVTALGGGLDNLFNKAAAEVNK